MKETHVRFDWVVKNILRHKEDYTIINGFLSEVLKEDVAIIDVLESESNSSSQQDKFNRVDVKVKNDNGEIYIIEIQNNYKLDYFHRMLFGVSKAVVEHMKAGENYSQAKKVISINIVYFDLGRGHDYVYHGKTEFEGLHAKDMLELSPTQQKIFDKQNVSGLFPEYYILKVEMFQDIINDTLDQWIYFFKNSSIKDTFDAKGIQVANEQLQVVKLSEEEKKAYERHLYDLREDASEAFHKEVLENMEKELVASKKEIKASKKELAASKKEIKASKKEIESYKKEKIAMVKNMIQSGLPIEQIVMITGLSIEEVEKMRS